MVNQFADLRSTVRYIGRVLGDVIRGQDGEALFDRIEAIRKASVAFHRDGTREAAALMAERLAALESELDRVRSALVPYGPGS